MIWLKKREQNKKPTKKGLRTLKQWSTVFYLLSKSRIQIFLLLMYRKLKRVFVYTYRQINMYKWECVLNHTKSNYRTYECSYKSFYRGRMIRRAVKHEHDCEQSNTNTYTYSYSQRRANKPLWRIWQPRIWDGHERDQNLYTWERNKHKHQFHIPIKIQFRIEISIIILVCVNKKHGLQINMCSWSLSMRYVLCKRVTCWNRLF